MNISQTISDLKEQRSALRSIQQDSHRKELEINAKIRKLEAIDKKAQLVITDAQTPALDDLKFIMDNIE